MANVVNRLTRSSKTKFAKMISFLVLAGAAIIFSGGYNLLAAQDLDILNCYDASFNSCISCIISSTRYQEAIDSIFTDENVIKRILEAAVDDGASGLMICLNDGDSY